MLNGTGRARVEDAVRAAERGTAGEIVVVLDRQASTYPAVPPAYGLLATLLVPWPLVWFTALSASQILAVQLAAAFVVLAAAASLGLAVVPHAVRRTEGRRAAAREFVGRGLADTRGRTGVLLYVALAERYAEVIGDVAISAEVAEEEWRGVIEALVAELSERRLEAALVAAVGRIGAILARHVPPGSEDSDELPNRIVIL